MNRDKCWVMAKATRNAPLDHVVYQKAASACRSFRCGRLTAVNPRISAVFATVPA
jgi:hypothetical protein